MGMDSYKAYMKACGGKNMSYGDYSSYMRKGGMAPMDEDEYAKAEQDFLKAEEEEEEADEDEDEGEEEEAEKSEVDVDDLLKSIAAYEAVEEALSSSGTSRESYLKAKLDAGTISKSEQAELGQLWAGMQEEADEPIHKSLSDRIAEDNPEAAQLVDASDLLKSWVSSIDSALESVATEVTRDGMATRQLLKAQGALVKTQAQVIGVLADRLEKSDRVVNALAERLNVVERTPAPRRSVGNHDRRDVTSPRLAKSRAGGDPIDGGLTRPQIQAGLRDLMVKAHDREDDGAMDVISKATARFEQGFGLPDNILQAVRQVIAA